jgi:hypothetical protein
LVILSIASLQRKTTWSLFRRDYCEFCRKTRDGDDGSSTLVGTYFLSVSKTVEAEGVETHLEQLDPDFGPSGGLEIHIADLGLSTEVVVSPPF